MKNIYFLSFLFSFVVGTAFAQPGKVKESWGELKGKAEFLMEQGDYYAAAEQYKKLLEIDPKDIEIKYKEAEAYRMGRDYKRAASAYKSVRRRLTRSKFSKSDFPLIDYHYALMLKQAGEYEDAEEIFFIFTSEYKGAEGEEYLELAKTHYAGCKLARMTKVPLMRVEELDALSKKVNSKYTESSPTVLEDGSLVFASLKSDEVIELENQTATSSLYKANIEGFDKVRDVEEVDFAFDKTLSHVGGTSVSKDGQRMYVTICTQEEGLNVNCSIYISQKNGDNEKFAWGRPRLLGNSVNMEDHNSSTPFVTSDAMGNDILYYASDRPGTLGGMDIWAVTRNAEGEMENLVNLGDGINTVGDEISPFIDDAEGYADARPRLYFSSNGRIGYGGLDVFMAYKNNVNFTDWSAPENAGRLLNSPADDMGFVLGPDKKKAYFVSNRVGGYSIAGRTCCDDIFVAQLEAPEMEKIIIADLGGLVYDEKKAIKTGVDLLLYDVTSGKELLGGSSTGLKGYSYESLDLERDYVLEMRVPGYEYQEYRFSTKNMEDSKTFRKDFYLVKIAPVVCGTELKIFGDSGKATKSLLANANLKIYRMDGGKTLFKELTTDAKGVANLDLPADGSFSVTGSKDGYLTSSSSISTMGATKGCSKSLTLALKEKRKDIAFNLDNILYDFNSDKLRDESIPNLEVLYGLLSENPSIIVEISSHTDSKGTDSYNQKLSQGRAQSVVTWLVNRGIPQSRLVAKGYGESVPKVPNTNPDGSDNPENRQINRRTEFKIIGEVRN